MSTTIERLFAIAVPLLAAACATRNSDDSDDSTGVAAVDSTTSADASTTSADTSTTSADASTSSSSTSDDSSSGTESTGSEGESSSSESTGEDPVGNCCEPQVGAGCDVPAVAECVCARDLYCCVSQWDLHCVSEVSELGCGECS